MQDQNLQWQERISLSQMLSGKWFEAQYLGPDSQGGKTYLLARESWNRMVHHPAQENLHPLHGRGNPSFNLDLQGLQTKDPSVDDSLEAPEGSVKKEGVPRSGEWFPRLSECFMAWNRAFFASEVWGERT